MAADSKMMFIILITCGILAQSVDVCMAAGTEEKYEQHKREENYATKFMVVMEFIKESGVGDAMAKG